MEVVQIEVVKSQLSYATEVWFPASVNLRTILERVQRELICQRYFPRIPAWRSSNWLFWLAMQKDTQKGRALSEGLSGTCRSDFWWFQGHLLAQIALIWQILDSGILAWRPTIVGLQASVAKKNAGGYASRDLSPGSSVNVLVALGSPGSGLKLLAS